MTMVVVVNAKGGSGKSTTAIHLIAPWLHDRTGDAKLIELDDENTDSSDFSESDVVSEQLPLGKDQASYLAIEKVVERSIDENLVIDVGGNRTATICLKNLAEADAGLDIDLFVVPVSNPGKDVENAGNTIQYIKSNFPDYAGKILLVITRAMSENESVARRENPDAFDLAEAENLAGPLIIPQDQLFSGARQLRINAWEVGLQAAAKRKEVREMKEASRKMRDLDLGRKAQRLNAILVSGENMHGYLSELFTSLDTILPIKKDQATKHTTTRNDKDRSDAEPSNEKGG